jgi:polyisoprenoid-binding protein YceI
MSSALEALACQVEGVLPLASLSAASVQDDELYYQLDQSLGPFSYGVRQGGLFAARGELTKYSCVLALHRGNMRVQRTEFAFDLTSFVLRGWEQAGALPPAARFDVVDYPVVRFRSTAVGELGDGRQVVRGLADIGGVTRLQVLDLTLSPPRKDAITGTEVVDLLFKGRFEQRALGIALSDFVASNMLDLRLSASVEIDG